MRHLSLFMLSFLLYLVHRTALRLSQLYLVTFYVFGFPVSCPVIFSVSLSLVIFNLNHSLKLFYIFSIVLYTLQLFSIRFSFFQFYKFRLHICKCWIYWPALGISPARLDGRT